MFWNNNVPLPKHQMKWLIEIFKKFDTIEEIMESLLNF